LNQHALQRAAEVRNQLRHSLVALVARERDRRKTSAEDDSKDAPKAAAAGPSYVGAEWSMDSSAINDDSETLGATLRRCVAAGYFTNVARLGTDGQYATLREGRRASLHPSCVLARYGVTPEWVVFGEAVWTTSLYLRDVSAINPTWLLEAAPHFYATRGGYTHGAPEEYLKSDSASAAASASTVGLPLPARLTYRSAKERKADAAAAAAAAAAATAPKVPLSATSSASTPVALAVAEQAPAPKAPSVGVAAMLGLLFGGDAEA
jgi:HrpA-like RNA helicase